MHFHHPLLIDFPQHRDLILRLKHERPEFKQMADEYHDLDRHICLIERDLEPATDQKLEELKFRRLHLKDKLYHEILLAAGHAPVRAA
jgi:uncharacterized protein YdcH (DUF465 family)